MIGRLDHVGIVVPDLAAAVARYRDQLGATVSEPLEMSDHGLRVAFVELPNTRIELLQPTDDGAAVVRFLERHRDGGIHHLCYEVDDVRAARDRLRAGGARVLGSGEPEVGAQGKRALFLHPKDFCGSLIELQEAD